MKASERQILTDLVERLSKAVSLTDVNIAAGIAVNELASVDERNGPH